jgi:acetyl esterase/lipase
MVRQRLAPQNPFPAVLLDVFQAYLTLLAPPPGCPHEAVPPSSIVVAGDSSGGCLALGLLQILLRLQRRNASITFHGQIVEPAVPSGMALLSAATDLANSFPSFERNADCDIFPVPIEKLPYLERSFPTCPIWPARPPRANLYCEAGMLAHSLASPAASEDWSGSCPLWIALGQEQIVDASKFLVQTAHAQGVSVTLHEYERMPHTFFWIFGQAPQTRKILTDWAKVILSFARGEKPPSSACFIRARGLIAEPMDIERLVPYTVAKVRELMWNKTLGYKVPSFHGESRSTL